MFDLFKGKCGLIMGVVNECFIVWGIVKFMYEVGVELVFIY